MDFREGGRWQYYMEGPDGSRHYSLVDYQSIIPNKLFSGDNLFCDEKGNLNNDFLPAPWKNTFSRNADCARVEVDIRFASEADMKRFIEMGFKEGFAAARQNLDELLGK